MWVDIQVYDYDPMFRRDGQGNPLPWYKWPKCNWCPEAAMKKVYRRSTFSGLSYDDFACTQHANEWAEGVPA